MTSSDVVFTCRTTRGGENINKELRKIAKALHAQGFEVTVTSKQHLLVRKDGVVVATISGTPSDHRSLLNGLARLRRAGFRWPPG